MFGDSHILLKVEYAQHDAALVRPVVASAFFRRSSLPDWSKYIRATRRPIF